MMNLFRPKYRTDEVLQEIKICLDKGWTGLGFKTEEFEKTWCDYTKLPYAHFLSSNTVGLHLALNLLKKYNWWNDGDEIITTPLTFVSTNHAILYERLKPIFADVDDYLCLNPESVESKITDKTKAVMYVGFGGNTGRLKDINDICKRYNLKFILDAAHMSGTKTKENGKIVHIGYSSDATIFSFQAVKNLPTADSGMICFSDEEFDKKVRKLTWLGIDKDTYRRTNQKGQYKWMYNVDDVGFKYHGNSIMASIGLIQLKYLDEDNRYRNELCKMYEKYLGTTEGINLVPLHSDCIVPSRHLFQIRVSEDKRNKLINYLNENDIFVGVHYIDNTEYKMYRYAYKSCPNSRKISSEIISLPLHLYLEKKDIEKVSMKIIEGLKKI